MIYFNFQRALQWSDFLDIQNQNLKFDTHGSAILAADTFNANTQAHSSIEKENQYK